MSQLYVIVQARTTSTRLPNKVLKPLCGKSVLEVLFERLENFHDNLIIATTDDGSEVPIVALCEQHQVRYHRGSVNNVLSRYYHAAISAGATQGDTIVRVTSDCPLIESDNIAKAIELFQYRQLDYVWVDVVHSFPRGMDAEVFSFDLLQQAYDEATQDYDKEHVTPYFKNDTNLNMAPVASQDNNSHYRLTLDTPEDYEMITATLDQHQDISCINQNIKQKK
jgi:spore coat polysaccharide biosynthesis protein SpsF